MSGSVSSIERIVEPETRNQENPMAANVTCALCNQKTTTANLATGYLGYCKHCNIYWHSKCHVVTQCPHCHKHTR